MINHRARWGRVNGIQGRCWLGRHEGRHVQHDPPAPKSLIIPTTDGELSAARTCPPADTDHGLRDDRTIVGVAGAGSDAARNVKGRIMECSRSASTYAGRATRRRGRRHQMVLAGRSRFDLERESVALSTPPLRPVILDDCRRR